MSSKYEEVPPVKISIDLDRVKHLLRKIKRIEDYKWFWTVPESQQADVLQAELRGLKDDVKYLFPDDLWRDINNLDGRISDDGEGNEHRIPQR